MWWVTIIVAWATAVLATLAQSEWMGLCWVVFLATCVLWTVLGDRE